MLHPTSHSLYRQASIRCNFDTLHDIFSAPPNMIGAIHDWGAKNESLTENGLKQVTLHSLVCLDLYCGAYFGSYLHLIFLDQYNNQVIVQGLGLSKILFWFLHNYLLLLAEQLTLGLRNENVNKNYSKRFQFSCSHLSFNCVPIKLKMYCIPIV